MRAEPVSGHARAAVREGDTVVSRLAPVGARESIGGLLARNAVRWAEHAVYAERKGAGFESVTWARLLEEVAALGRFLAASGVRRGDRVAVCSPNRGEMLVVELAVMGLGAIYVPLFAGYSAAQTSALLEHAGPAVLIVSGSGQLEQLVIPPTVRALVSWQAIPSTLASPPHTSFRDALARFTPGSGAPTSEDFLRQAAALDPDRPALLMYTSGTSGPLKGVLLTHDNILSQQRALAAIWQVTPEDRLLSYLPWHHSFGGIFEKYTALANGATLFLDDSLGKDFDRLLYNWMEVRPTVYFSVPKVYQQLVGYAQTHPQDEARVFHPELRFVFTAAAALPANLSTFFADRGIPVLEGWGLTETSPCCTVTDMAKPRTIPGMVGYPIPGVEVRVHEDGEILVRGPNVMRGYYRDPAATAKVLPGDGWFHTGDLGEFVDTGLRLIARKDRVFKLLNAEKVVPTTIENRLAGMNPYIRHVIVAGDGRSFLAALIFPDLFRIQEEFGEDRATADRMVKESLRKTVLEFNRDHPVKYERIEAFVVISKDLSIEDYELTPSLKVRVHDVLKNAEDYLEAVYQPSADCDCRFLRKVMRLSGDQRRCFAGADRTLDCCHECGSFVFDD